MMTDLICKKEHCSGCGACYGVCPVQCIAMKEDEEGFLYPHIDSSRCLDCGACRRACPVGEASKMDDAPKPEGTYAAYALDGDAHQHASSGGVAPLLARKVLEQGGAVFGAAFAGDGKTVVHICVQDAEQLNRLRGSKYVQSDAYSTYLQVQELLKLGKPVLFTGTPCQIAGLKAFLRQDPPNLITQSVLCHGVPSARLWSRYLAEREQRAGKKIVKINFRDESTGWHDYRLSLTWSDGTQSSIKPMQSAYLRAFNKNLSLRPSCSSCSFKGEGNCADLILGDFWGIREICPQMEHEQGVSLVIVRTEKGRRLWEALESLVRAQPVSLEAAVRKNKMAVTSAVAHPKRREFFWGLEQNSLESQVRKCCPLTWKERLRLLLPERLRRVLRK